MRNPPIHIVTVSAATVLATTWEAVVRTLDDVNLADYDFFDFGTGAGASLLRCQENFGGRGLGIDINHKKIARAQQAGLEVVYGDIATLPRQKLVRYVCLDNFLEHLPDYDTVRTMLSVASTVATDFLYIVHPSFEDEAYLRQFGLKQFWQHWTGHTAHLLVSDLAEMLTEVGARPFDIEFVKPAWDSDDTSILPLDAPIDQRHYDAAAHGPKPTVKFDKPVHWQVVVTAHIGGSTAARVHELERQLAEMRNRRAVRWATAWWRMKQRVTGKYRSALRTVPSERRRRTLRGR